MKSLRVLTLAGLVLLTLVPSASAESPRSMMLEIHAGPYEPQIDRAFMYSSPYTDYFSDAPMVMFGLHWDYQVWQDFGSLAVGVGARIGWTDGLAVSQDGSTSSDPTSLNVLPMNLSLTYRFDWLAQNIQLPLVPYAKVGMTYSVWWVTNGSGEIANTYDLSGEGRAAYGGTFGLHVGGGLQFLLDWFGAGMAAEFDSEVGVNNSYLFLEYAYHSVNDFGAETSFDLGDANFSAGIMFEF
jgi:hypothetical protein